jgi:hypothetical protein
VQWPWVWLPVTGPIRISTVLAGVLMVSVILWRRRDPALALVALLAWASAYEILYQVTGALVHGWPVAGRIWMVAALAGWVFLAGLLRVIPNRRLLLALALVWLLWVALGFESNAAPVTVTAGMPKVFTIVGEACNEVTKTLLAIAYLVAALDRSVRSPVLRIKIPGTSTAAQAHHDPAHQ